MTLRRKGNHRSGFPVYRMRRGDVFWQKGHYYVVTSVSRYHIGARKMHP